MIWHLIRGFSTAFGFTLMLLAIVYTEQARTARDAAPSRIGEAKVEKDFLVDYAETRQEMIFGFLREKFPDLKLPDAPEEPANSLSLEALQSRTASN